MTKDARSSGSGKNKPTTVEDFAASREEYVFGDEDDTDSPGEAYADDQHTRSPELLSQIAENDDYYATLGLQRQPIPSDGDIRAAYHQLSLTFHPDKHAPERWEAARRRFELIQIAYDVLSDPQKRSVYDLLGAEAVKEQWSRNGIMGIGGEAEKWHLGARAMSLHEFRKFFLSMMRQRERRFLEELVESRSTITVGINAQSALLKTDRSPRLHLGNVRLSRFRLSTSYNVPVPWLYSYFSEEPSDASADDTDTDRLEGRAFLGEQAAHVTLTAGIGGPLQRTLQEMRVEAEDGEVHNRKVLLPHSISTRGLTFGATSSFLIHESSVQSRGLGKMVRGLLRNTAFEIGTTVLPIPTLFAAFSRPFSFLSGTQPVNLSAKATAQRSLLAMPPVLECGAQRRLGTGKVGYCSWNSGSIFWPDAMSNQLMSLTPADAADEPLQFLTIQPSSFAIGLASQSILETPEPSSTRSPGPQPSKLSPLSPSYNIAISATPQSQPSLTVAYSINIFRSNHSLSTPLRSSFSPTTYSTSPPPILPSPPPSLRLTLSSTLAPSGPLSYTFKGLRPITPFTNLSFNVSILPSTQALTVSFSLSRLSQTLTVPIALFPLTSSSPSSSTPTTRTLITLALALPLATYAALDFCILQPRYRRSRARALRRHARRVGHAVRKRRTEAIETAELMWSSVTRRQERERAERGLVIVEARWGTQVSHDSGEGEGERGQEGEGDADADADVTIPLASMVERGQLVLGRGVQRAGLMGWWDPCPGREKVLKVRYLFGGMGHEVVVGEGEDLTLPMRRDLVGKT